MLYHKHNMNITQRKKEKENKKDNIRYPKRVGGDWKEVKIVTMNRVSFISKVKSE